jgi:hypothetical protein
LIAINGRHAQVQQQDAPHFVDGRGIGLYGVATSAASVKDGIVAPQ